MKRKTCVARKCCLKAHLFLTSQDIKKKKNNGEIPKNRTQLNKPKNSMNSKKYDINKQKKNYFFFT